MYSSAKFPPPSHASASDCSFALAPKTLTQALPCPNCNKQGGSEAGCIDIDKSAGAVIQWA